MGHISQAAYDRAVNQLKEVVSGSRGWVSLTKAARECGLPKGQLKVTAKALGLKIGNHGNHGLTAHR